jgi:hypothetical protein
VIDYVQHEGELSGLVETQKDVLHSGDVLVLQGVILVEITMYLDHTLEDLHLNLIRGLDFSTHGDL